MPVDWLASFIPLSKVKSAGSLKISVTNKPSILSAIGGATGADRSAHDQIGVKGQRIKIGLLMWCSRGGLQLVGHPCLEIRTGDRPILA